jgi:hypothetical protein
VPIGYEARWAQEPVWTLWRREKSCTAGNRAQAVQPVAHCYTDWAISVPQDNDGKRNVCFPIILYSIHFC